MVLFKFKIQNYGTIFYVGTTYENISHCTVTLTLVFFDISVLITFSHFMMLHYFSKDIKD